MGNAQGAEDPNRIVVPMVSKGTSCNPDVYFDPAPPPLLVPGVISKQEWTQKIGEATVLAKAETASTVKGSYIALAFLIGCGLVIGSTESIAFPWMFFPFLVVLIVFNWIHSSYPKKIAAVFEPWVPRGVTTIYEGDSDRNRGPSTFLAFNLSPAIAEGAKQAMARHILGQPQYAAPVAMATPMPMNGGIQMGDATGNYQPQFAASGPSSSGATVMPMNGDTQMGADTANYRPQFGSAVPVSGGGAGEAYGAPPYYNSAAAPAADFGKGAY